MDAREYKGQEWVELLKHLNGREIKKGMRAAIRTEARKAQKIAQGKLAASGLNVRGNSGDWKKGIRVRMYPDRYGGGFMITVKPRGANRKTGKGEAGMHQNRFGEKKPILLWAEEGTTFRRTKTKTKWFVRSRRSHRTGRMKAYGFMKAAEGEMIQSVEAGLVPAIEESMMKQAKKAGWA